MREKVLLKEIGKLKLYTLYHPFTPENFSAWSSKIVANTALNELRKNQPMLFSEMSNEQDDGSELFYEVEDTYVPNQPELNYTEQEEQNIVREMIDSLKERQELHRQKHLLREALPSQLSKVHLQKLRQEKQ